jgi:integrase
MAKKKSWVGRLYIGRDPETGKQQFEWLGRFDRKSERDAAVAEAKRRRDRLGSGGLPTVDEYVDRYLTEYEEREDIKASTVHIQRERLKRFKADFTGRPLDVPREEIKDWMNGRGKWAKRPPVPNGYLAAVSALYNHAIHADDLPLEKNPARQLCKKTKGRRDLDPPTPQQFDQLLDACEALGDYAPTMRAITKFAAFSLMRPSELYALEWPDIDFDRMRIQKARRLFRGELDKPKTGEKEIALTPPARDALLGLDRDGGLVFRAKRGGRLSAAGFSGYWSLVLARAGLDFDFYHATKHYGVWYMRSKLNLSKAAIAAQAGWSESAVDEMLRTYGHSEVGALDEVDRAFAEAPEIRPPLRVVGGSDALVTQAVG